MNYDVSKRRLVIAHNPHSARAKEVQAQVFDRLDAAGYAYETIEVQQAHLDDNVARLVPEIHPHDIVLSAAGDGSAHAVAHTVMAAHQPGVELGFLAFGNFNDVPNTFNTKATLRDPVAFLEQARSETIHPVSVYANDQPLRNALLYVTLGWTAKAANRFDDPTLRYKIKNGGAGVLKSLWRLGLYYLQTRRDSRLAPFHIGAKAYPQKTDVLIANGPAVARLFKSGKHYYKGDTFLLRVLDVRWIIPNIPFIIMGLLGRMKGAEVREVTVQFDAPSRVPLQCDGEVVNLEEASTVTIKKSEYPLTILATK